MALVTYSSSEPSSEAEDNDVSATAPGHARKKRRLSPANTAVSTKPDSQPCALSQQATQPAITGSKARTAPPPPPPPAFANLYATAVRTSVSDDPSLHGGRARSSPHVAGQWTSHVYVEWSPTEHERSVLERVIAHSDETLTSSSISTHQSGLHAPSAAHSLLVSPLGAPAPLHISLSSTLPLQSEQREIFRARLRTKLQQSGVSESVVRPRSVRWVDNGLGTRAFLVLHVVEDEEKKEGATSVQHHGLGALLDHCNAVAEEFGFDPLYTTPETSMGVDGARESGEGEEKEQKTKSGIHYRRETPLPQNQTPLKPTPTQKPKDKCHVSIAWRLPPSSAPQRADIEGTIALPASLQTEIERLAIPVTQVKLKMGNAIEDIPLGQRHHYDRKKGGEAGEKSWFGW